MAHHYFLGQMTWPEVAALAERTTLALVPMGATEAHGPHLPLETDVIIALGACRRAADLLAEGGIECAIAPPFVYAVTNFGLPFAGTITIPAETLTNLVVAVGRSLAGHGFGHIVFANHHLEPANFAAIQAGVARLNVGGMVQAVAPDVRQERWASTLTEEFRTGARHAGSYETSLILAERPDLVREEERQGLAPVWIDLPACIRRGAHTFADAGAEMAYVGDPAGATVEEGQAIFAALAQMTATAALELLGP
jgi:creatinine amidohydrolase